MKQERFAIYGFETRIPSDWRVEMNQKTTREQGDIAFQSPKGNRVFVSWGPLSKASRFKTLEEHRDNSITQLKKGSEVKTVNVSDLKEMQIMGHRALVSHVTTEVRAGMMGRNIASREIWSVHFHCPELQRYYVMFSMERDHEEFEDMGAVFESFVESVSCHTAV